MNKTIKFTLKKNGLSKEAKSMLHVKGYRLLSETLIEEIYDDSGKLTYGSEYYIYTGKTPFYGMCCKIGDRFVFARYSRYDSVSSDFSDYALDCDETGFDSRIFETKHIKLENGLGVI